MDLLSWAVARDRGVFLSEQPAISDYLVGGSAIVLSTLRLVRGGRQSGGRWCCMVNPSGVGDLTDSPSAGASGEEGYPRPWGLLRGLAPAAARPRPDYRYDPVRQIAVTLAGEPWTRTVEGSNHSSVAERDGDEGRSEDWGEDAGKDVTEGS